MFWAEDMSNLVQKVLDCESKVIYGNINDNWEIIIDHLIQGKSQNIKAQKLRAYQSKPKISLVHFIFAHLT